MTTFTCGLIYGIYVLNLMSSCSIAVYVLGSLPPVVSTSELRSCKAALPCHQADRHLVFIITYSIYSATCLSMKLPCRKRKRTNWGGRNRHAGQ
ncbi:hypothetical protein ACQKWADRAFT_297525 [Trichoderma austrokoningii]